MYDISILDILISCFENSFLGWGVLIIKMEEAQNFSLPPCAIYPHYAIVLLYKVISYSCKMILH